MIRYETEVDEDVECFVCTKCGASFDQYYWEYDGEALCFDHYLEAAGHVCGSCNGLIRVHNSLDAHVTN